MKILFLSNRLPHKNVAGGHRLIYQRMRHLADRGHQVGLATFVEPHNEDNAAEVGSWLFEMKTVPAVDRHLLKRIFHDYPSLTLPAIYWKYHSNDMMHVVGDMVEQSKYDVVLAEFGEMGMYLYRNPYLSAVRKVVSCHRCLTDAFGKYIETRGVPVSLRLKCASQLPMLERYEFEMYSAMDHILALTAEDRFILLNHAPQLPVSVIPPGIDFDYFDRQERKEPNQLIIMMCGYFADNSNHDGAIWFAHEVWPIIEQKYPDVFCYFVGASPSMAMKHLASKNDRIKITGAVDDLRPYREQATIFINPMRLGSGLRIKMLEAMATGLPVVTTALGAAGIPAQNGVNCFMADTPRLFADSIGWLLNDAILADHMGQSAREMIRKRYDIRATTQELEKVLNGVVYI